MTTRSKAPSARYGRADRRTGLVKALTKERARLRTSGRDASWRSAWRRQAEAVRATTIGTAVASALVAAVWVMNITPPDMSTLTPAPLLAFLAVPLPALVGAFLAARSARLRSHDVIVDVAVARAVDSLLRTARRAASLPCDAAAQELTRLCAITIRTTMTLGEEVTGLLASAATMESRRTAQAQLDQFNAAATDLEAAATDLEAAARSRLEVNHVQLALSTTGAAVADLRRGTESFREGTGTIRQAQDEVLVEVRAAARPRAAKSA